MSGFWTFKAPKMPGIPPKQFWLAHVLGRRQILIPALSLSISIPSNMRAADTETPSTRFRRKLLDVIKADNLVCELPSL